MLNTSPFNGRATHLFLVDLPGFLSRQCIYNCCFLEHRVAPTTFRNVLRLSACFSPVLDCAQSKYVKRRQTHLTRTDLLPVRFFTLLAFLYPLVSPHGLESAKRSTLFKTLSRTTDPSPVRARQMDSPEVTLDSSGGLFVMFLLFFLPCFPSLKGRGQKMILLDYIVLSSPSNNTLRQISASHLWR